MIPITIGVTGHRDLRPENISALESLVRGQLRKLKTEYPNSPFRMLSSLAAGADCLCARIALEEGIELVCPLPATADEYRKDFTPDELAVYEELTERAECVFTAPDTEPEGKGRTYRFRQAGIYVAEHCHVLLALWDGNPPKKDGCGTAEAVDFMLRGVYSGNCALRSPAEGAVIHVYTPRISGTSQGEPYVKLIENVPGTLESLLKKTDSFNRDCKKYSLKNKRILPEYCGSIPAESVYSEASGLSAKFKDKYYLALKCFSYFCVLLVLSYLLYDEAELIWQLAVYGIFLTVYFCLFRLNERSRNSEKYIEYRMLAESLRVQTYLSALSINLNTGDSFTWTQKSENLWIKKAVCCLQTTPCEPAGDREIVIKTWLEGQLKYHTAAAAKDSKAVNREKNVSGAMVLCTALLFIFTAVLELRFTSLMTASLFSITVRSWLKILWGCFSAATLFVSGYYGAQATGRRAADHNKMKLLFEGALNRFYANPENADSILSALAREEIIESGNWQSYTSEHKPDFSI